MVVVIGVYGLTRTRTAVADLWPKLQLTEAGLEILHGEFSPFTWHRPDGPVKVALQVGHLRSNELPEEQQRLRTSTGTSGGGKAEWQTNLAIAEATKAQLEKEGYVVEMLPATIPENYWADIFIAIHADGSTNTNASGYKSSPPYRDKTGKAAELSKVIDDEYGKATGLPYDPQISRNMRGYYAFSWWRFDHAVHPMTTAVIVETGFLTNANDRKVILNPEKPALAIIRAIKRFAQAQPYFAEAMLQKRIENPA